MDSHNGHPRRFESPRPDPGAEGLAEVIVAVKEQGSRIARAIGRLGRVQLDRARLSAGDALLRAGAAAVGALVLTVFGCAAALRFLDGLSGCLAAATGRSWAGALLGGLLGLAGVASGLRLARARRERRLAALLSQRYRALDRELASAAGSGTTSDDTDREDATDDDTAGRSNGARGPDRCSPRTDTSSDDARGRDA